MTRRRRGRWVAGGAVLVLVVGGGIAAYLLTAGSGKAPAAQPLATTRATRGNLTETVDASFTLAQDPAVTLRSPAAGVITRLDLTAGAKLGSLGPLLELNGAAVYGIPSAVPFYRNLTEGDSGDDVKALQAALKTAGHDPGATDGTFGASTAAALEAWQADQALTQTPTLALSSVVSYPPGSVVVEVSAKLGDRTGAGTALASQTLDNAPGTM